MKIMFVTSSLSYGGAAKVIGFLANGLCEKGHYVCIANLMENKLEVQDILPQITVQKIITHESRYIEKIEKIIKLRQFIHKERPNIIVAFKSTPAWITCLATKFMGIPVIFSERGDPYQERLNNWREYPYWKLINHSAGAVFQTDGAKGYFEKGLQNRSTVIPNPIKKIECNENMEENDKSIVSFGRLDNKQKRYDIMLDAFHAFHSTHKDYKLKIYGTGDDEQVIKKWVREKDLQDAVEFLGYAGSPYKNMKNGNIFLITSDFEGISNAMLEAMAAGFPVISTDSSPGGASMVITNRENGLLVPIGDSQKIAAALTEFADDISFRNKCAMQAKDICNRFSPDKILNQWEEYLLKVSRVYRKT